MENDLSFVSPDVAARQKFANLSRRRFLRGLGACIALPAFESLVPRAARSAYGATPLGPAGRLATTASGAPLRTAWVYVPNGAIPSTWWPNGEPGRDFQLNKTMESLAGMKNKFQVLSGLNDTPGDQGPDGGGDHARAGGTYLTGVRINKSNTDIRAGISIDQVIAGQIGHLTSLQSLELTCDDVRTTGGCDSGYGCAYEFNMSWKAPTQPATPEPNPRLVFERMFGAGAPGTRKENLRRRMGQQKSILDYVMQDAAAINGIASPGDKQKLDQYLTSLRDIEQRIQKAESMRDRAQDPNVETPSGIPQDYPEYLQLVFDMLILAFQTDQTRIATFMMAYEGSNRTMPFLGFPEGHHTCTHHNNQAELVEKTKLIDKFYVEQFAKFLSRIDAVQDVDGNSLLHNSMIVYGSAHADGNRHTHNNLPIILAGGGGGALTPGQYTKFGSKPVTNLFLSLADRMGCVNIERHGDSDGRLTGL